MQLCIWRETESKGVNDLLWRREVGALFFQRSNRYVERKEGATASDRKVVKRWGRVLTERQRRKQRRGSLNLLYAI